MLGNKPVKMRYICTWPKPDKPEICGTEFEQVVARSGKISIICPKCGGGLKTWKDGEPVIEEKK
jgi:hypothetical protein